jgi:EpsI family protein
MDETPKSLDLSGGGFKPTVNVALLLQGGILLVLFLSIFGPALRVLYNDWFVFKQFSHGLLVPFIAGYMAWQKRRELQATPITATWWGMILIVPALILALGGKAIGDSFTERIGMVLCLSGLIWVMFGLQLFKQLWFPLGYLFLMIPLPYVIVNWVAFQLRIFDATAAAPILQLLGIPVYRDNYFLHLPDITLEVADLCSGISSVFSLFALGGAYVFFSPMRLDFKIIAVLSTVPFAVLVNLLRIIITAALTHYVSLSVLNVLVHELTGTITFFIALALFIISCEVVLRRFRPGMPEFSTEPSRTLPSAPPILRIRSWRPILVTAALLVVAVYLSVNITSQTDRSLSGELVKVGSQLPGYQIDNSKKTGFYNDPAADFELSRVYKTALSSPIELYIGFKGKQQAERLKSPRLGFPYGWNYVWLQPTRLSLGDDAGAINATWMLIQNGQTQVLVLYWFQTGDQTVAGEFERRIVQIRNALLFGRSDGAVLRLATPLVNSDNIDEAKKRLATAATHVYSDVRNVLPL